MHAFILHCFGEWHSQKACSAAITCCCLPVNHAATCKQHTDEGGSSKGTYGVFFDEGTSSLWEGECCALLQRMRMPEGDWGEGVAFPCFHQRINEQEDKVNCAGMGHVFINPA